MSVEEIGQMHEALKRVKTSEIQNAKVAFWPSDTLNDVLRQLRRLTPKVTIKRDYQAGTVVVTAPDGQELVRGLKSPMGWVMRYNSELIVKKEGGQN